MSNIKRITITGRVPYNTYTYAKLNELIGNLAGPSFGLGITYGNQSLISNKHGGRTTMYDFIVSGEEAVRIEWIAAFINAVKETEFGTVDSVDVFDLDCMPGRRVRIKLPEWE